MEQKERTEPQNTDNFPNGNGTAGVTQVGQVIRNIASATQRFPAQPPPQTRTITVSGELRERIVNLVAALGDPAHELHQQAVQELVGIGDVAVPALNEALNPRRSWLTAYRAAEALSQIGDGRATGALIEALRHPNSNVRWSAVRALSALGDARALVDLYRVARHDQGRTSWGEPVAGAAQSALDQMRNKNVLLRGADLVKTAVACVLMLVGLVVAWSVITTLQEELTMVGLGPPPEGVVGQVLPTPAPTAEATVAPAVAGAEDEAEESTESADDETTEPIVGSVLTTANVRAAPDSETGERIGTVSVGDDVIFLATSSDNEWFLISLGDRRSESSQINSTDGTGWVIGTLLTEPDGDLEVQEVTITADE
ncbi:MAG: HEAT repeat domain-containing protein [Chloroflexota bacterium]